MSKAYTDPRAPGAPRVGDLVVVAIDAAPDDLADYGAQDRSGSIEVLSVVDTYHRTRYPWSVVGIGWVHAVRHPTPEELAVWQLTQGTP